MKRNSIIVFTVLFSSLIFVFACEKDKDDDPQTPVENINPGPCDSTLNLVEADALKAAQALDVCKMSFLTTEWGLVSVEYTRANGSVMPVNNQFGVMNKFGTNNNPVKGSNLLVLSTGAARTPGQPGSCGSTGCNVTGIGTSSPSIPANVPGCPNPSNILDDVSMKLTFRVPPTATGFAINHNFFTFDYPEFVCTAFNDQFQIIVNPAPAGSIAGNVAFDALSKPIGVNCSFIQGSNSGLLAGTGFDTWGDAASTGWLRTTVPVVPGSTITIQLLIYDVGDGVSDSSVLLDNFQWLTGNVTLGTTAM
jgi:hypothetical protein